MGINLEMTKNTDSNHNPGIKVMAQDDEIDLSQIFSTLAGNRWKIVFIAALVFLVSVAYAFIASPVFRADVLLQIEERGSTIPGFEDVSEMFGETSSTSTELALVKSRRILGATVDELNLSYRVKPNFFPVIGKAIHRKHREPGVQSPFLGLNSFAWGGESLLLTRLDFTGSLKERESWWTIVVVDAESFLLLDEEDVEVARGKVGKSLAVEYGDSWIELFVSQMFANPGLEFKVHYFPRIAAINELAEKLIVSEKGGKDTGLLQLSLEGEKKKDLLAILNSIANNFVRINVEQRSKEAQQILTFIDDQLPALKEKLEVAESKLQAYRQKVGTVDLSFEVQAAVTKLTELEKETSGLELKRTELRQRFTDIHPTLTVVNNQIEQIAEQRDELEDQLRSLPETEWEYIQRNRDVTVATELYLTLLNKGQELKVAKAGTVGNVQIVDDAAGPFKPVRPKKIFVVFIGMLLGLFLGVLWVLIAKALKKGIEDPDTIESELGVSVFANIPHSSKEHEISRNVHKRGKKVAGKIELLAYVDDSDKAIEALRSFRTSLQFALKTSDNNLIVISGPSPSIGKSFVSANFAAVMAKVGHRVLLVDADMRKGHLEEYMGITKSPGLSELIAGKAEIDEVVRSLSNNYYFVPRGEVPPNPAELLMTESFKDVIENWKAHYDVVIIDTPPILAVTDPSIIAQYAANLFLLVRYGRHTVKEVKAAVDRFQKNGVTVSGVVLNDVPERAAGGTLAYAYYGYGDGHT